ncbi:MAG TPA: 30S ribosomal protein S18 [Candidatus Saccharibacteria bacterium]|nr:30S ribosomal protein S18 [Candidatus Saccharibacteria bacterium]HMT39787.1 30S ribosomal protein S18 [Candidatus Saccharibacteria bacterium]
MTEFYQAKQNKFYTENVEYIDYKDYKTLQKYINSVGKIESRKRTGASMKHQRMLAKALKRARHIGLLPFVVK